MPAASSTDTLVVAAFEPFGRRRINRSWTVVQRVEARPGLERVLLPVELGELAQIVPDILARKPRALLMVGESYVNWVCVETVALNIINPANHDDLTMRPTYSRVCAEGPAAYETSWDAAAVVSAIEQARVRVTVSHHAGTYACNAALYHALRTAAETNAATRIGFLHVPASRGLFGPSSRSLARAVEATLATMLAV